MGWRCKFGGNVANFCIFLVIRTRVGSGEVHFELWGMGKKLGKIKGKNVKKKVGKTVKTVLG